MLLVFGETVYETCSCSFIKDLSWSYRPLINWTVRLRWWRINELIKSFYFWDRIIRHSWLKLIEWNFLISGWWWCLFSLPSGNIHLVPHIFVFSTRLILCTYIFEDPGIFTFTEGLYLFEAGINETL